MLRKVTYLLLLVSISSFGQEIKLPKRTGQNIIAIPGSSMMVDQYEVTLGDWFAFMHSMYNSGVPAENIDMFAPKVEAVPEKLHNVLDVYLSQYENEEFSEDYQSGSNSNEPFPIAIEGGLVELLEFPVSGISFHQVEEYLLWRGELINRDKRVEKTGYTVHARLPAPMEWDKVASTHGPRDIENTTIYPDSMNTHGCYLMNVQYRAPCESTQFLIDRWGEGLFQAASYFPDISGLFDFFGNVAEMTNREGIAKGGSFRHWAREGWPGKKINYNGPTQWLGFRVWFQFYNEN